jgi:hypothetical protein
MFYLILIIIFIAVFAFLFWRIIMGNRPQQPEDAADTYVCPVCNENECECHKVEDPE